jgi:hypothetical protein
MNGNHENKQKIYLETQIASGLSSTEQGGHGALSVEKLA